MLNKVVSIITGIAYLLSKTAISKGVLEYHALLKFMQSESFSNIFYLIVICMRTVPEVGEVPDLLYNWQLLFKNNYYGRKYQCYKA